MSNDPKQNSDINVSSNQNQCANCQKKHCLSPDFFSSFYESSKEKAIPLSDPRAAEDDIEYYRR